LRSTEKTLTAREAASSSLAVAFALLAVAMLATPLMLFALGCVRNSVFLVDSSGALYGSDFVVLLWVHDQWFRRPSATLSKPMRASPAQRRAE
jgi:hypothetical protein